MNTKEREALVKRLTEGRINNFKKYGKVGGKGKGMTGKAPFGYFWEKGELKIDEEKARYVRQIYNWRNEGLSYRKIAMRLRNSGVITNRGKQFSGQAVMNILKNQYYLGELNYAELCESNTHIAIISNQNR